MAESPNTNSQPGPKLTLIPISGIAAFIGTTVTTCFVVTIGRLVLRWQKSRRFGADDYLNAAAVLLLIPFTVIGVLALPNDYHGLLFYIGLVPEPPSHAEEVMVHKLRLFLLLLFWLILYMVKASILALYWQLFSSSLRARCMWWCTCGFTAASFGVTWISIFWQCGAPSNIFDYDACSVNDAEHPSRLVTLLILWCSLNVVGGILLMTLPLVMVKTRLVNMQRSAKLGLVFIFSLVLFDMACDIVRTVHSLSNTLSYGTNLLVVWTFLEPMVAVIVCALPCYKGWISRSWNKPSDSIYTFQSQSTVLATCIV